MKRVQTPVQMDEAIKRALVFLAVQPRMALAHPSSVAYAIWPNERFLRAQGAAGAASRILRVAEKRGLVAWDSNDSDWGWRILAEGRAKLRELS